MNRKIFSTTVALALMTVAAAASAHAQDTTGKVKAHIPFAFSVSNSMLPAGDYSLSERSPSAWIVRNDDGSAAVVTLVRPNGTNEDYDAKLVFKQCGDRYFLSEVRAAGEITSIPASGAERALEREMARNGSQPETVYVLASLR
jgi:hypothetical protein